MICQRLPALIGQYARRRHDDHFRPRVGFADFIFTNRAQRHAAVIEHRAHSLAGGFSRDTSRREHLRMGNQHHDCFRFRGAEGVAMFRNEVRDLQKRI